MGVTTLMLRIWPRKARALVAWGVATNIAFTSALGMAEVPAAHAQLAAALTFNGSNYVQVASNASLNVPTNLTLEARMKPTTVTGCRRSSARPRSDLRRRHA